MGGWGSGRQYGRPKADESLKIDIAWMIRTKHAVPGGRVKSSLHWTCRGEPSGNISYTCDMVDLENANMELRFTVKRSSTGESRDFKQQIPLSYTVPNYGGRRWWMHCPINGDRVGKLYVPDGGDIFASRRAWRLGYHSQRIADRDRPFEKLFRLQKKLGSPTGVETPLYRPKGMWQRTYEKHLERYWELDEECNAEMVLMMNRLNMFRDRF